jgi:hypothetical protein
LTVASANHVAPERRRGNSLISGRSTDSELLILAAVLEVPVHDLMRPEPGEEIELPSGDWMDAAEISRHVFGDPETDPRLATVGERMQAIAAVADALAREARGTAEILTGGASGRFTRDQTRITSRGVSTDEPSFLDEHQDVGGERVETREHSQKES